MVYARRLTRPKPLQAQNKIWTAPTGGWVSNRALANPDAPGVAQGAAILDNFVPTASTVRLRRGREVFCALPSDPLSIFAYKNGNNESLFSTTASTIYEITTANPVSKLTGKTGGDWSVVQFATTGGVFLVGVNGADPGFLYDGGAFGSLSITFSDGTNTFTTADMSHVWVYKNRLWFAQKNSMNAWYLAVDSIGGAATWFPLSGVFGKGGALLFGQSWSLDTGEQGGLSEQNIFCSTQGEVAIYQGTDPSVSTAWQKVGVYRIGTPLGKKAFIQGGGDIAIATSVGLVPLSKAISLDVTALNVATISYNISDAWSEATQQRGLTGWCAALWPEQKIAFVSPPDLIGSSAPVAFVSNSETGAWCRFTNWRMLCIEVFRGELYFGSSGGNIYLANKTGLDDTIPYTGAVMPLFTDMGSPSSLKIGKMGRTVSRSLASITDLTTLHADFDTNLVSSPDASGGSSTNLWSTGTWGTSVWGASVPEVLSQDWQSLGGSGYALTLAYQVTSGALAPLDTEVIRHEMVYTTATIVT